MELPIHTRAYIAGLVDGEGCFTTSIARGYVVSRILVASTNHDIARWLKRVTKLGWTTQQVRKGQQSDAYYWYVTDTRQALDFITIIYPFLRIKQRHARVFRRLLQARLRHDIVAQRKWAARLKPLNRRGRKRKGD